MFKHSLTLILLLLLRLTSFAADDKVAIIKDKDGFVNVRSGPGKEFEVVAVVNTGEPFYCETVDSEWVKIHSHKYRKDVGYMHRSGVQLVELLSYPKQKELITSIFEEQKRQAEYFQANGTKPGDPNIYYSDDFYSPMLAILPGYFCETKDRHLIQLFFATMWADSGSASEMPAYTIGQCFACETDIVIEELAKLPLEQRKNIIYQIEFGLVNIYSVDNNGHSTDPDYERLMKRLKTIQ